MISVQVGATNCGASENLQPATKLLLFCQGALYESCSEAGTSQLVRASSSTTLGIRSRGLKLRCFNWLTSLLCPQDGIIGCDAVCLFFQGCSRGGQGGRLLLN